MQYGTLSLIRGFYTANMGRSGERLKITVGTMINGKLEFIETMARRNGGFWTIDLPVTFFDQPFVKLEISIDPNRISPSEG